MNTASKPVLGLVITDGVGYRNFVLSNFLKEANKYFSKIIIYTGLPKEVYTQLEINEKIEILELPVYRETSQSWFWRKFKEVAHLQLHKGFFGINDNLKGNYPKSNSNRSLVTKLIFGITNHFHSEEFIQWLERQQQRTISTQQTTKACKEILKKHPADLLFFTHQRPPYVLPLFTAAKECGIKTSAFIFSWDNLSSKGRMAATFDFYVVWSELMKKELLYFYPATPTENVKVGGTPQFEPYVLPKYSTSREEFFRRFDIDPELRTICYSCGDISTSKNDELYISIIAEAILRKQIDEKSNFIVRTSPAEAPDRFLKLKEKYPFIKWNFPAWYLARQDHPEPWSQRLPKPEDLRDLRSLLEYCDLNVNMCSTMGLDFMLFDKPVVNPVLGNENNGLYNDQRFLNFGHYENVVKTGATKIVTRQEELIEAINQYLETPGKQKEERKELVNMQIGVSLDRTSGVIASQLSKFCQ
ncbi:hypothetical protein V6B16_13455 [Salinimicrobium catena]|uniref:hypothetical protein n=1 Tax=Salinimicrobium catena TaxID=390640 RepID=UPI002FE44029